MKKRAIIVGAGLAGSIIASQLLEQFDVTVIDLALRKRKLPTPILDEGISAKLDPHVGAGPGGTTNFWHNGLIELEADDFQKWPFGKEALVPYYKKGYEVLGGVDRAAVSTACERMRERHIQRGVPEKLLGNCIFYPQRRRNLWRHLGLKKKKVRFVVGNVTRFELNANGLSQSVIIESTKGEQRITGDVFICCAGGLSSPVLMSNTAQAASLKLPAIGSYYNDHPMAWIAQIKLDIRLYDIWNHFAPSLHGSLRMPFVVREQNIKYCFYIRTQSLNRRGRMKSVLTELRNAPFNPKSYFKLLRAGDDIIEILAFKFGINIPSWRFSVLMLSEQEPQDRISISGDKKGNIVRHWDLPISFAKDAEDALRKMLGAFGDRVREVHMLPGWQTTLQTGAHHSGTCKMGTSPETAVCDANLKVFGTQNLFICDGSVLPQSGYANTGLTIGALALKLSDHLVELSRASINGSE